MRTFTHTSAAPVDFRLDIGFGRVEVVAEDRTDATVTLSPIVPGDAVAADLIKRARCDSDGGLFAVTVPRPPAGVGAMFGTGGVTVVQGGRIVSGTVSGVTITGNGNIYVGGNVGGLVNGISTGGGVLATVRVPHGSRVDVHTDAAGVRAAGPLAALTAESVSGDVRHVGTVDVLDVRTVSGDIAATARCAHVSTTSGDVRVTVATGTDVPGSADLRSVSGDVSAHATTDATVTASSVSGDIRVTHTPGVLVRTRAHSVSGDVRLSK